MRILHFGFVSFIIIFFSLSCSAQESSALDSSSLDSSATWRRLNIAVYVAPGTVNTALAQSKVEQLISYMQVYTGSLHLALRVNRVKLISAGESGSIDLALQQKKYNDFLTAVTNKWVSERESNESFVIAYFEDKSFSLGLDGSTSPLCENLSLASFYFNGSGVKSYDDYYYRAMGGLYQLGKKVGIKGDRSYSTKTGYSPALFLTDPNILAFGGAIPVSGFLSKAQNEFADYVSNATSVDSCLPLLTEQEVPQNFTNAAPYFVFRSSNGGFLLQVKQGKTAKFKFQLADLNGGELILKRLPDKKNRVNLPRKNLSTTIVDNLVTITWKTNVRQSKGQYLGRFSVSDSQGLSSTADIIIEVI